jgi:hypothetical protein
LGVQVAAVALTAGQLTVKLELGRSWGRTFVRVADYRDRAGWILERPRGRSPRWSWERRPLTRRFIFDSTERRIPALSCRVPACQRMQPSIGGFFQDLRAGRERSVTLIQHYQCPSKRLHALSSLAVSGFGLRMRRFVVFAGLATGTSFPVFRARTVVTNRLP